MKFVEYLEGHSRAVATVTLGRWVWFRPHCRPLLGVLAGWGWGAAAWPAAPVSLGFLSFFSFVHSESTTYLGYAQQRGCRFGVREKAAKVPVSDTLRFQLYLLFPRPCPSFLSSGPTYDSRLSTKTEEGASQDLDQLSQMWKVKSP